MSSFIWALANLKGIENEQEAGYPGSLKCLEFLLYYLLESGEYKNVLNDYIESASIAEAETDHLVSAITDKNMTVGRKYEAENSCQTDAKQST